MRKQYSIITKRELDSTPSENPPSGYIYEYFKNGQMYYKYGSTEYPMVSDIYRRYDWQNTTSTVTVSIDYNYYVYYTTGTNGNLRFGNYDLPSGYRITVECYGSSGQLNTILPNDLNGPTIGIDKRFDIIYYDGQLRYVENNMNIYNII